ncbi:MAG: 3-oxoacyl-ACP reductase FabG [Ectothiorhodospiraceae bacterium]|jgi:3-oxoacyl-[acyl-carrier protein] reductase
MKRALITGGSGAIGGAVCRALAADGLHVIVHANRNRKAADALVTEIRDAGGSAESVVFDVTDQDSCRRVLESLVEDKPVQVLVNNAGITADGPMAGMAADDWHRVVDVSLNGFYNVTQPLLMAMMGTRWGRIVSVSSVSGVLGNRGQANYAAAKAGLHGATKSLAREVASRGVTVNVVAPGVIDSEMTRERFDRASIRRLVPMGRVGRPEEVAAVVSFLASEAAGYVSGQIIGVDGAMT